MSEKVKINDFYCVIKGLGNATHKDLKSNLFVPHNGYYVWLRKLINHGFITGTGRGKKAVFCVTEKQFDEQFFLTSEELAEQLQAKMLGLLGCDWVVGFEFLESFKIERVRGLKNLRRLVCAGLVESKKDVHTNGYCVNFYRNLNIKTNKKTKKTYSEIKKSITSTPW